MLLTYAGASVRSATGGGPVAGNREERNRVFGSPQADPNARQGKEPQRALGFPVDSYGPVDRDWLRSIAHPIKGYKRWAQRRHLGPYAPGEGGPQPKS
jgi:hypothetical protein